MNVRVCDPRELTAADRARWCAIQAGDDALRSPYFRPEYTEAVAAVRDDVRVAVLGDSDGPGGFFPFQTGRFGIGRPVGGPLSDYQALIAAAELELDPHMLVRAAGLTSWDFDHLLAAQPWFAPHHKQRDESPIVAIPGSLDEYLAERKRAGSKIGEQTMRRWRKAAREVGEIRFVEHTRDREIFDQICRWKSEQYTRTEKVDVLSFPWTTELLWRLLDQQGDDFAGTLSALYFGDRLVAGHIGMRSRTVWHWWFPSYDAELSSHSPGTILLIEMIRAAAERGLREIDLGKGAATYKDRFRTHAVSLAEGSVVVPSLVQSARRSAVRAWDGLRRLPLPGFLRAPGRIVRRLLRRGALR